MTEELPADPTGYRPSAIRASRDLEVGQELEPIVKQLSLDKSRIYQGWPAARNRHTDYQAAQATGLREPNINGGQTSEYIGEMFIKFFGSGFVGGSLTVKFIGFVGINDTVTVRGVVTGKDIEGDRAKLAVDMWAENQDGVRVLAASATGYAD
jgi:acyl dehydratase